MLPFAVDRLPVFGLTKCTNPTATGRTDYLPSARPDPGPQAGAKTVGVAGAHAHTDRTLMLQGGRKPKVTVRGNSTGCINWLTPLGSLFEPGRQSVVTQSNFA